VSRIDDLRAEIEHYEVQEQLEQQLAEASAAHEDAQTEESLAAHDAAAVALAEHRAKVRGQGIGVGGDAVRVDNPEQDPAAQAQDQQGE
jgi:hypothetical protein